MIIPTRNSAKTLPSCLESLLKQTYSPLEIIVVDNYSSDDTRKIAMEYSAKILLKGHERSAQVNHGASHAKGRYVYRVDSDVILEPDVVTQAVAVCELHGYHGAIIRIVSDPTVSLWSQVRFFERGKLYEYDTNVAVRFVRKDVFADLGGFDDNLVAFEDYDFHNRFVLAGYQYGRIRSKERHLGEPKTLAEITRKHYYYGKYIRAFLRKNWRNASSRVMKQLAPTRRAHIDNFRLLFKDPKVFTAFFVYQIVRYFASFLGLLGSYVR
ncbi:MAG: glycosyltransferase family A protein [Candidatus Bathyarchaeota archaeon]